MTEPIRVEGLAQVVAAMEEMSAATNRNVCRRALRAGGQPIADTASRAAPERRGVLSLSIVVSPTLNRREKRAKLKASESEMYVGPAGGAGATYYASHVEFGTIDTRAQPYMRPAWEGQKETALRVIAEALRVEVAKAAARQARKAARLAGAAALGR